MESSTVSMALDSKIIYPWIRKIGHYDVTWKIENYSYAFCDKNSRLETPVLYISGPQLTKWKLMLNPTRQDKTCCAVLSIKRLRSDQGPEGVWVQWKSWIKWFENNVEKQLFLNEHETRFEKNQVFQSDTFSMKYLIDGQVCNDKDVFEVRYMMVFAHERENNPFNELFINPDMRSLSNALSELLTDGNFYDLRILTQFGVVRAHKEILYYRNKVLAEMIESAEERGSGIIDLSDAKMEDVFSVIRYLYTGNVDEVLHRPSLSKKVLLSKLKVSEISDCYVLDNLFIESKYGVETSEITFQIKKYSRRIGEECITRVINHGSDFQWVLQFYPNGLDPDDFLDYAAVTFGIVKGEKPSILKFEVSLLNNGLQEFNTKKVCTKYDGHGICLPLFAKKDVIKASLMNDSLIIRAKLLATKNSFWKNKLLFNNDLNNRREVNTYKKLSLDMESMLKERKYCNVTLQNSDFSCQAHSSMLYARIEKFWEFYGEGIFAIPKTKKHAFHCFLHYLYTGVLKYFDFANLYEIYMLADLFLMDCLQLACSKVLKENIDLQTVFDILICSDERRDECLKHMALKFISENLHEISEDSRWRDLMQSESPLRNDIEMFLEADNVSENECD